jgi:hypothetical protein
MIKEISINISTKNQKEPLQSVNQNNQACRYQKQLPNPGSMSNAKLKSSANLIILLTSREIFYILTGNQNCQHKKPNNLKTTVARDPKLIINSQKSYKNAPILTALNRNNSNFSARSHHKRI